LHDKENPAERRGFLFLGEECHSEISALQMFSYITIYRAALGKADGYNNSHNRFVLRQARLKMTVQVKTETGKFIYKAG